MIAYLKKRKTRKLAREWLHQARHARDLREDIAAPDALKELDKAIVRLQEATNQSEKIVQSACNDVAQATRRIYPPRKMAWLRENLEIALVAVAVAMAFRTYFVQPFKIPTGSMQPTLYGIHYESRPGGITDRKPLKLLRWVIYGEWHTEYRAQVSGIFSGAFYRENDPSIVDVVIGGVSHRIPASLMEGFRINPGERVARGQILAAGTRILGDHIFVNRVIWNFRQPQRGEVMVFTTRGIPEIDQDTHYIKRMVGMPSESIGISPPYLLVNEEPMLEPEMIRRITMQTGDYAGYQLTGAEEHDQRFILNTENDRLPLGVDGYAAFGDNTGSSLDSRYWGPVPQRNLVGPAFAVYWPISGRWGRIR